MKKSKTMELKKPVRVSLSRQVLTAMESMIRSGKWKVGDRIPAEAELARAFSVSHNTIREALQSLIHMGMLEARPGAYLFLGTGPGAGLHHPAYDFNDEAAPVGASFFARLVERALPL